MHAQDISSGQLEPLRGSQAESALQLGLWSPSWSAAPSMGIIVVWAALQGSQGGASSVCAKNAVAARLLLAKCTLPPTPTTKKKMFITHQKDTEELSPFFQGLTSFNNTGGQVSMFAAV